MPKVRKTRTVYRIRKGLKGAGRFCRKPRSAKERKRCIAKREAWRTRPRRRPPQAAAIAPAAQVTRPSPTSRITAPPDEAEPDITPEAQVTRPSPRITAPLPDEETEEFDLEFDSEGDDDEDFY